MASSRESSAPQILRKRQNKGRCVSGFLPAATASLHLSPRRKLVICPLRAPSRCSIDSQILPYFKDMTFYEINRGVTRTFARQLCHQRGDKKGKPLSKQRVANIFLPLRAIWHDVCDEYKWEPADPFSEIHKYYPKRTADDEFEVIEAKGFEPICADRDPLRFGEFQAISENFAPWYRPVAELMVLTGMIALELAGLTPFHLKDGFILVRRSISRGVERIGGKTQFRRRDIRITPAIQQRLDVLLERTEGRPASRRARPARS